MSKYTGLLKFLGKRKTLDSETTERLLRMSHDGGPGSGNFGHAGRPGKVGGSSSEGGASGASGGKRSSAGGKTFTSSELSHHTYSVPKDYPLLPCFPKNFNDKEFSDWDLGKPDGAEKYDKARKSFKKQKEEWESAEAKKNGYGSYEEMQKDIRKKQEEYRKKHGDVKIPPVPEASAEENYYTRWGDGTKKDDSWDMFNGKSVEEIKAFLEREKKKGKEREESAEAVRNSKPSTRYLPDPAPFEGTPRQAANHYDLESEQLKIADWCFEEKNKYPKDSETYKILERHERELGLPNNDPIQTPSKEDSEEKIRENLAKMSPKLKKYAQDRIKKDYKNEHQITSDLCDITRDLGTNMYGLDHRFKKPNDRVAEKIEENIGDAIRDRTDPSYEAAVDRLSDIVRYTQACTTKNLVSNFEKTRDALEKKGYKCVKVKNTWQTFDKKKPYRGLNCVFESPTGTKFELQFHTPESLVAKEIQHPWYEEFRSKNPEPTEERKEELANIMLRNMARMQAPDGIERVKNYPPK